MNLRVSALALAFGLSLPLGIGAQQGKPVALEAADCERLNQMFGDFRVGRVTRYAKVPMTAATLEVRPPGNGGIHIERGSGREYAITACVAAGASTAEEAQRLAEAARLRIDGNRVQVENVGASGRSWSVQLIVEVPDGGSVDAETQNGPLAISGASGTFNVRAANGPIAIDDVSGKVTARASNGPVSVSGSRGDIDASTQNGPISVVLKGARWDGRLHAQAHSGPLDVVLPADYRSGIEISSSGGSPWDCRAAACRGDRGFDRGSRTLRTGPEPVVVKVSTVNGPVVVR